MKSKIGFAALLAAALMLCSLNALAQETAPLGVTEQEQHAQRERLSPFGRQRSCYGVAVSSQWMRQLKVGNRFLGMRLYTTMGEQITFQEKLTPAPEGEGSMRLLLRASERGANLMLQMDQEAVDTLIRLGVVEIVVADTELYVQAKYRTQDLAALRSAFAVGGEELLCVSGETQPVTVVGVDGVRRYLTK